jgi:dihydroneopterin aldolase/2-amino-4-hydroxy-6-hydroxymethyldihydropteridine diphosphokinase
MTLPAVTDASGRVLDRIHLVGLTVRGRHGVYDDERRDGQDFTVDVVLHLDTRPAAATDDLSGTVDYGELARSLASIVSGEPVDLIETLAERLAAQALDGGGVEAVDVTVHKPSAPLALRFDDVMVAIRRHARPPSRAVLALGSNLGDRRAMVQSAVDALASVPGIRLVAVSALVETEAVGGPRQPDYLNAVVLVDTTLAPQELLGACRRIETGHGRRRCVRWGPRTLDIDIIDHSGTVCFEEDLTLPHPRAAERAFVLVPWLTVDPGATLPAGGPSPSPMSVRLLAAEARDLAGVRFSALPPLRAPR